MWIWFLLSFVLSSSLFLLVSYFKMRNEVERRKQKQNCSACHSLASRVFIIFKSILKAHITICYGNVSMFAVRLFIGVRSQFQTQNKNKSTLCAVQKRNLSRSLIRAQFHSIQFKIEFYKMVSVDLSTTICVVNRNVLEIDSMLCQLNSNN